MDLTPKIVEPVFQDPGVMRRQMERGNGVNITRDDAIRIISLVACVENESLADLDDYELAKRLIEHFGIPDENRMLDSCAQAVERRKNWKPSEPPPALDLSLAADLPGLDDVIHGRYE